MKQTTGQIASSVMLRNEALPHSQQKATKRDMRALETAQRRSNRDAIARECQMTTEELNALAEEWLR